MLLAASLLVLAACGREPEKKTSAPAAARPSILLVTLDTTRADAIGPEAAGVDTPAFNAIAMRGIRFRQAYATVPETLPSHTSIMTGLYPGGHGVHQNARYVPAPLPLLAEQLQRAGYHTSAFVSAFVLSHRFGLARGFDIYEDVLPDGRNERNARETTDAALRELRTATANPRFVWVHYYDPHAPYESHSPDGRVGADLRSRYLGEVRFMDEQLGRLSEAFRAAVAGPSAEIIVADHGEGLGDHGEAEHGRLLYQSTMHVPLVIVGSGIAPHSASDVPVSTRRVYHTILDFAGVAAAHSLRGLDDDPALGEAMNPFLEYGWQPQVMAVAGRFKAILAGRLETYDVQADPAEVHDLGSGAALPPGARKALEDYPVPSPMAQAPAPVDEDARRRLAALGYVSAVAAPLVRKDAPRPKDMTALFPDMDLASGLFTRGDYVKAIPVLARILARDPHDLDAQLRLATSYSSLGRAREAEDAFRAAAAMAPDSQDVRVYLALHYARTPDWLRAIPLLEKVVQESPDRLTAVEALGQLKAREGAAGMQSGDTPRAIAAFERARALQGTAFHHDLDLGVLYMDARRFDEARAALDRALAAKPGDPMALFKRAQVAVLLREPDAAARIDRARQHADPATRDLIAHERLFAGR